jgi:hypothetical protein
MRQSYKEYSPNIDEKIQGCILLEWNGILIKSLTIPHTVDEYFIQ